VLPASTGGSVGGGASGLTGNAQTAAGGDGEPRPLAGNRPPRYPYAARRANQEGRLLLRVVVDGDGRCRSATVAVSSGVAAFDNAALEAVAEWRFRPARRAGVPLEAVVEIPVAFRLQGNGLGGG